MGRWGRGGRLVRGGPTSEERRCLAVLAAQQFRGGVSQGLDSELRGEMLCCWVTNTKGLWPGRNWASQNKLGADANYWFPGVSVASAKQTGPNGCTGQSQLGLSGLPLVPPAGRSAQEAKGQKRNRSHPASQREIRNRDEQLKDSEDPPFPSPASIPTHSSTCI